MAAGIGGAQRGLRLALPGQRLLGRLAGGPAAAGQRRGAPLLGFGPLALGQGALPLGGGLLDLRRLASTCAASWARVSRAVVTAASASARAAAAWSRCSRASRSSRRISTSPAFTRWLSAMRTSATSASMRGLSTTMSPCT
ncbi:hypothetical protein [Teichococcus aestuarii]